MPLGRYGVVLLAAAAASSHWGETSAWAPFVSHRTRPHRITTPRLMSTSPANAVKRLPDSAVELAIPVPAAATQAAYDKVCRELARTVQIPGFRKGSRIPPPVLEQALAAKGGRNALKTQAINELVGTLVEPALKDANLQPIGQPTLLVPAEELANDFEAGKSVTLTVRCDVWPDVEWKRDPDRADDPDAKPYLGLTGSYRRKPFNQPKLDLALNDLRERYATLVPITDAEYRLQMGDACTVNMVGYLATPQGDKGEPLPNAASGDRVEVILGTGRYMEGLVEGLVGAKVGETKAVQVNFPEKLRDKSLAGKRAIFDVEVLEASERQVPEVTDEFANQVKAGLTAETLLAELRKAIDAEDAKEFTPARNKALGQALADVMDMQVPDTLVSNQAREKFAVMMSEMRDSGVSDEEIKRQINPENFAKYKEIVKDDIIKDFKVSIAADEIGRLENVQVPDYQVEEQMEAIRKDAAESKQELDENMIRGKVEATLQRQAVFDWLAERSQLQVEFEDDYFDEALMEKLAKESLEREEQIAAGKAATPESGKLEPVGVEAPAAVDAAVEENVVPVPAETEPEPKTEKKEDETVVETTAPEPVPEEEQKDPVVAETTEDEEAKKERYASMTLEDRAFAILQDIGLAGGDETTTKK